MGVQTTGSFGELFQTVEIRCKITSTTRSPLVGLINSVGPCETKETQVSLLAGMPRTIRVRMKLKAEVLSCCMLPPHPTRIWLPLHIP